MHFNSSNSTKKRNSRNYKKITMHLIVLLYEIAEYSLLSKQVTSTTKVIGIFLIWSLFNFYLRLQFRYNFKQGPSKLWQIKTEFFQDIINIEKLKYYKKVQNARSKNKCFLLHYSNARKKQNLICVLAYFKTQDLFMYLLCMHPDF